MTTVGAIELDVDVGELADEPDEIYELATMVNVACGAHAGDAATMARSASRARAAGARVAAHPSYPDRASFGRRTIAIEPERLRESVRGQVRALATACEAAGVPLGALKLHGALYHDADRDPELAALALDAAMEGHARIGAVLGPPGGETKRAARLRGLAFVAEGFADRRYGDDGRLLPRTRADATIDDPAVAAEHALALVRSFDFGALCVHGDRPRAVDVARAVRAALAAEGLLRPRA